MKDIEMIWHARPTLKNAVLIEGLPGVGNVGKIAAEHLIDELGATKFLTFHSKYFPPQVLVGEDGVVKLVNNEMYFHKRPRLGDIVLVVGDYQGLTPEGQYELADRVLEIAESLGVKKLFTLGGYGVGKMVEEPRVLGAATDLDFVEEMKKASVVFSAGEPGSGIVGASGLLLGLGLLRKMRAVCLMGETSGYFVDPKSARAVLSVLMKVLKLDVDLAALEVKAAQIERITQRFREIERGASEGRSEDLRYIG